uniref:Inositol 1,4,5-triphosphate receptor associated 1 n=1 Tax=Leptobrachium leishanense TaxID=445787 RepID=A0A8C5QJ50_9ANUR
MPSFFNPLHFVACTVSEQLMRVCESTLLGVNLTSPSAMPTVPGDEEHVAERGLAVGGRTCITPAIILLECQDPVSEPAEKNCLEKARPHSPSPRAHRHSRSSLSSPTSLISVGLSPTLSPKVSPEPSRSNSFIFPPTPGSDPYPNVLTGSAALLHNVTKGLADRKQNDQRKISQGRLSPRSPVFVASKETLSEQKENFDPLKHVANTYRGGGADGSHTSPCKSPEFEVGKSILKKPRDNDLLCGGPSQGPSSPNFAINAQGLAHDPPDAKFLSRFDPRAPSNRPPLLRALSWDSLGPGSTDKSNLDSSEREKDVFAAHEKINNKITKFMDFKDFHIQPVRLQKLTKLREEHKMMRSHNLTGQKLPDLSEAAEQERGSSPTQSADEEEGKGDSDVMPNIPDILLRKLRIHKCLPNSAPPLTEKEVENVFVQLALAFRNDSYTLDSRLNQAERERNLTEDNNEKELEAFKAAVMSSSAIWQTSDHREAYQKLLEDIAVLHRLTTRLSSRAEMVGAVRQEKRMSRATEVMMQYVENLKRTYEKDHAELMEYKKLANQNSSRNYGGSDDGVPRSSRSMSLTIGKNMPRRRVSVAVVPKFNLLNIPGQSPSSSPISGLPSLTESPGGRSGSPITPGLSPLTENGKAVAEAECDLPGPAMTGSVQEEISPEIKARIEEEAYNKGYQEGLKKTQGLQQFKEEEEEKPNDCSPEYEDEEEEGLSKLKSSKIEECIDYLHMLYPKLLDHWNVFSIVAAGVILLAVLLSMYNSLTSCAELPDGPSSKATCSATQKYSWFTSGLQQKQRRQ